MASGSRTSTPAAFNAAAHAPKSSPSIAMVRAPAGVAGAPVAGVVMALIGAPATSVAIGPAPAIVVLI